jgi:ABC-type lipoprotein export system ATPase subunit
MSDPVLAARDLTVRRDGETLLSGVSLTVAPGDRVLIRGPSGAGKTTLFRVLGLLTPPTEGTLTVAGTAAGEASERTRARLRRETVGVVFQDFNLVPDLTARENAAVPMAHAGDPDEAWLDDLFDRLGLAAVADQRPATLSGGEKQRVAIARALANRPAVVLADEPTGQLDPETGARVLELLVDVQRDLDTALVVVSHDPAVGGAFERRFRLVAGELTAVEKSGENESGATASNARRS